MPNICSLPNEILAEIFATGSFLPAKGSFKLQFPLLVCNINHHWRDVAINSPEVWTNIDISFKRREPEYVTSLWLERSKSCLLNITLNLPNGPGPLSPCVADVVALLVKHSTRWRRFVAIERWGDKLDGVLQPLKDVAEVPNLEEVQLLCYGVARVLTGVFSGCILSPTPPSLRLLRLHGVRCAPSPVDLTLLDLTDLRAEYQPFRDVIAASPRLTTLVLRMLHRTSVPETEPLDVIRVPSLRSLATSFAPPFNSVGCRSIFSFLSMPNLEYLELNGEYIPSLATYFHSDTMKYTKLHTLRLANLTVRFTDVDIAFFCSLSTVEHLQLIHTNSALGNGGTPRPTSLVRSRSINLRRDLMGVNSNRRIEPDPIRQLLPGAGDQDKRVLASLTPKDALWPSLSTITLDTNRKDDTAKWLLSTISSRIDAGLPLTKVRLSHSTQRHLCLETANGETWLREHVQVEIFGHNIRDGGFIAFTNG